MYPPSPNLTEDRVPRTWRSSHILLGLVLALVVIAYLPTLDGDFVWDDIVLIRDNPVLRSSDGFWAAVFGDFFEGSKGELSDVSGFFRPLVTLINAATVRVFGPVPLPFHVTNLVVHLMVGLAFWGLLRRLRLAAIPAVIGLGIFVLHPIQTEAVAFISGRTDVLAALFSLLVVHFYLLARRASTRRGAAASVAAAFVSFLLALSSKEVALVLPLLLAVIELLGLADVPACETVSATPGPRPAAWPDRNRLALGLLVLTLVLVCLRMGCWPGTTGAARLPLAQVPLAAVNVMGLYARLLFWPTGLRVDYQGFPLLEPGPYTLAGVLVLVGAVAALAQFWRRRPRAALAICWSLIFLAPVLHVVPMHKVAAERYLYLPAMGMALGVGLAVRHGWQVAETRGGRTRVIALLTMIAMLVSASGATMNRAYDWYDELRLWSTELRRGQAGFMTYQNLAAALAERGRPDEAAVFLLMAWQESPGHPIVYRSLARLAVQGHLPECRALEPAQQRLFLAVAQSPRLDPAALEEWARVIRVSGCDRFARITDEMGRRLMEASGESD